mmetsp:Transcript_17976/g.54072  ORF Transcript_17976/g.54072 Transcript_17976/m.54072 type:complete len:226 (+) Transcript_17976:1291-1968(+)
MAPGAPATLVLGLRLRALSDGLDARGSPRPGGGALRVGAAWRSGLGLVALRGQRPRVRAGAAVRAGRAAGTRADRAQGTEVARRLVLHVLGCVAVEDLAEVVAGEGLSLVVQPSTRRLSRRRRGSGVPEVRRYGPRRPRASRLRAEHTRGLARAGARHARSNRTASRWARGSLIVNLVPPPRTLLSPRRHQPSSRRQGRALEWQLPQGEKRQPTRVEHGRAESSG